MVELQVIPKGGIVYGWNPRVLPYDSYSNKSALDVEGSIPSPPVTFNLSGFRSRNYERCESLKLL